MNQPTIDYDLYEYVIALNCTINDTYIASIIDILKLEYISNNEIRSYLSIIFDFYSRHQKQPNTTEIQAYLTTDELKKAYKSVLTRLSQLDTTYDYTELISNTERYIKEKAVYNAVKDTINDINRSGTNTSQILERFQSACNLTLVDSLGFDYMNNIDQHIHDISVQDTYIPTGFKWLNKMLGGGWLQNGRALYMFQGGTNVGKSLVLGNVATKLIEQGETVVIISLEMSEIVYSKRISSQLTRIPIFKLREESDNLKRMLVNIREKHPGARLIIKEFPPSSITANHLQAYIKSLKTKMRIKPSAIIIDYLTLLQSTNPSGSMYSDGKDIAEQVRALSYPAYFGCPIISANQVNRAGMSESNPSLDKSGESVAIPQTADAVISLWQKAEDKELGLINMGIQKSRFGINHGQQAFNIDYETLAIDEVDQIYSNTDTILSTEMSIKNLHRTR